MAQPNPESRILLSRRRLSALVCAGILLLAFAMTFASTRLWLSAGTPAQRQSFNLPPARLAAQGHSVPEVVQARESPVLVHPTGDLADLVSDEQLIVALSAALPRWHPPAVPNLFHELLLWGPGAEFVDSAIGSSWSGKAVVETLLNDRLCRERTVPIGARYLVDSPYGIHIVKLGTSDAVETRGEAHTGQLLKILGEAGVPRSTPVVTETGRVGTINEILQDGVLRFSLDRENEFMAVALALWLPPATTWIDQYGTSHSFNELLQKLIDREPGVGACAGCHVPYAVLTILRVDEKFPLISPALRESALRWLARISAILTESQQGLASNWYADWGGTGKSRRMYNDELLDQINVAGHHLEWIALAPEEVRPGRAVIQTLVTGVVNALQSLPNWGDEISFKSALPCAHAARALCLLRQQDAYSVWKSFRDSGRLVQTPKGYRIQQD